MTAATLAQPAHLPRRMAVVVFLAFALAYFFSALVRAITATLSPTLLTEFSLNAQDLGLLAGGYFLGFSLTQLPLGRLLDRHGPKKVVLAFLSFAVLGCLAFSWADSFHGLLAARVLCGMGVSACLMAPLTGYRRWFDASTQLRTNSWMLMTGSLGMLASTLPVQWLMPLLGWRPLFWLLAVMILAAMGAIAYAVPRWNTDAVTARPSSSEQSSEQLSEPPTAVPSYAEVWRSPYFRKMSPMAFFNYGGLVAIQTLWAGPWMVQVAGYTPLEAATGLFWINAVMLVTFWSWGMLNPWLVKHGWPTDRLLLWGVPLSMVSLAVNIALGASTGWLGWAVFCMTSSVMGLAQPAVGMSFRPVLAGRALSAYNLVIFSGVFCVQWGIGLAIDAFARAGFGPVARFQAAMGVFLCFCVASYAYFVSQPGVKVDNLSQ